MCGRDVPIGFREPTPFCTQSGQLRERRLTAVTVSMDKSGSSFVNDGILDVVVIVCSKKIDDPLRTWREYKLRPLQGVTECIRTFNGYVTRNLFYREESRRSFVGTYILDIMCCGRYYFDF